MLTQGQEGRSHLLSYFVSIHMLLRREHMLLASLGILWIEQIESQL